MTNYTTIKLGILTFMFVSISEGCVRLRGDQRAPRQAVALDQQRLVVSESDRVALRKKILLHNGIRNTLKCAPVCCLATYMFGYSLYNLWNLKADCAANPIYCNPSYRANLVEILSGVGPMCVSACAFCGGCEGCEDLCESNICYDANCCKKSCMACTQESCSLTKEAPSACIKFLKDFLTD